MKHQIAWVEYDYSKGRAGLPKMVSTSCGKKVPKGDAVSSVSDTTCKSCREAWAIERCLSNGVSTTKANIARYLKGT